MDDDNELEHFLYLANDFQQKNDSLAAQVRSGIHEDFIQVLKSLAWALGFTWLNTWSGWTWFGILIVSCWSVMCLGWLYWFVKDTLLLKNILKSGVEIQLLRDAVLSGGTIEWKDFS